MKENNKINQYSDSEWEELASILSGEKPEETELFREFITGDADTVKSWKETGNISGEKEIDTARAWNDLNSRIRMGEPGTSVMMARPGIQFTGSRMLKIAAMALILLGMGLALVYLHNSGSLSKKIIYSTGVDQKNLVVELPDGSRIFLNRNTRISYRSDFGKHGRNIRLSGEAFFEIAPDVSRPFIIDAGIAEVKVVGTSFNVRTDNDEPGVEVFVKTGKVMLTGASGSQSLILDPGFIGKINSTTSGKSLNNDPNYLAWQTGFLEYNGQKLDIVFGDLKKVYNMDIIADDISILENRWTSRVDKQPQDTIIRLICLSFNLGYSKEGNVYHLYKK
jgi:transmembrane sensor